MRTLIVLLLAAASAVSAEQAVHPASNTDPGNKVGEQPYEMAWANRKPDYPETVDFENLDGWTSVGFLGGAVDLFRSRVEQMFGSFVGKAVYMGKTAASYFELRPPNPIAIPGEPTAVQLWVRGNNWGWHAKAETARTNVHAIVRDYKGEDFAIALGQVNFDYWSLMHAAFVSPTGQLTGRIRVEQAPSPVPAQPGAAVPHAVGDGKIDYPLSFVALRVTGCSDERLATLSFDSLQFYKADYQRPLPELKLPPRDAPWPTTPDTITPTPKGRVENAFRHEGPSKVFTAKAGRDRIRWVYLPRTGTLGDLTVEINGKRFQPCADGAPVFELGGRECRPGDEGVQTGPVMAESGQDSFKAVWQIARGDEAVQYAYHFRAKGKSLQITVTTEFAYRNPPEKPAPDVIDTLDPGKAVAFRIGHTAGTPGAEIVSVPYLTFGNVGPHVVHWNGIFLSGLLDWYNSDASTFFEEHGQPKPGEVVYNGGSRYLPKTNGERNPLRERLILTVSSDFAEVLPNLPHPKNPMAHLATGGIWHNIGEPQPDLLKRLKAHGVERFICPLHEVGWRDAGESFTFRLRCAPRIGDEKMTEYGKWVHGLGYRFGLYANYTDYAPVNENWREDRVCMDSDGNWRGAWPRCYAPRPTWAWQAEADLAPKIAQKFGATTCYSDVHTCITPWDRTDYDARSPGAGMLRTVWDCYARILWTECQAYGGPVFSEGRMHWMYAGLVSGNYGQMTGPDRWKQPPLVDFGLLRLHPLQTDFGMGSPDMFFSGNEWSRDRSRTSPYLDRFITSTLAFGHIGYLALQWGFEAALKSFYMTNAVQQRYALVPAEDIRYFDGSRLLPTSEAIRSGAFKRGQVYVRYQSGLEVWCNLSFDQNWTVSCDGKTYLLPPTGHLAFKKGDLLQFSAVVDGQRLDYVESPDFFYLDTRGAFAAIGPLAGRGAVALRPAAAAARAHQDLRGAKDWWAIPCEACDDLTIRPSSLGLGGDAAFTAQAFDLEESLKPDGKPLGEAEVRVSNLGHTLLAVKGAVRYRIAFEGRTAAPVPDERVRRLVAGLPHTFTAAVANFGKGTLHDAAVMVLLAERGGRSSAPGPVSLSPRERERVGDAGSPPAAGPIRVAAGPHPAPLPAGEGEEHTALSQPVPLPAIRAGGVARVSLPIRVPPDAKPGERLWYQVRVIGRIGDRGAEGIGWFTGLAARAFDVDIRPETLVPGAPARPPGLDVSVRSHLPGKTPVTVKADSPALALTASTFELVVQKSIEYRHTVRYAAPEEPCVVPFEISLVFPQGRLIEKRWLRFARSKVTIAGLAQLPAAFLGMQFRGKAEEPLKAESGAVFHAGANTVGGVEKGGFFCHPPYKDGVGCAFGEFEVTLPNEPCAFETWLGFSDGSSTADGCVFSLQVRTPPAGTKPAGGFETLGQLQFGELKRWKLFRADLSKFRGQKVTLRLTTDVGPADNSHSDWACWGEPRIVLASDRLVPEVFDREPTPPLAPPPIPLKGLKAADLREIVEAKAILDGAGVDGGQHESDVYLNDVFVGHTPASASDEAWSEKQALPVPPEALKTLGPRNVVVIRNPRQDWMKVRRVHLWFRLRDGRVGTSAVVLGPFSTPPEWPPAEGESVPLGDDLPAMECDIPLGG